MDQHRCQIMLLPPPLIYTKLHIFRKDEISNFFKGITHRFAQLGRIPGMPCSAPNPRYLYPVHETEDIFVLDSDLQFHFPAFGGKKVS